MTYVLFMSVEKLVATDESRAIGAIAVLRSGLDVALPVWNWLEQHEVPHRRLLLCPQPALYWPRPGRKDVGPRIYSPMANDSAWYKSLLSEGRIGSASPTEFYDRFDLRFNQFDNSKKRSQGDYATAQPENVALLIDDVLSSGRTMQRCILELETQGYTSIYFCAVKPIEAVWHAKKDGSCIGGVTHPKLFDRITDGSIQGPKVW